MNHVSLVAFYGPKPEFLQDVIRTCQEQIQQRVGNCFQPYDMDQIHATIVGLDQVPNSPGWNLNYWLYRERRASMRFGALLQFLHSDWFPFAVQIGGFQDRNYLFPTPDVQPYQHTILIQDGKVVLRGWPVRGDLLAASGFQPDSPLKEKILYPPVLGEIRQGLQAFNILHKYHRDITRADNNFYFRIGLVEQGSLQRSLWDEVEMAIRGYLSALSPLVLTIDQSHLFFIASMSKTFPLGLTTIQPLDCPRLTAEVVEQLYDDTSLREVSGARGNLQ